MPRAIRMLCWGTLAAVVWTSSVLAQAGFRSRAATTASAVQGVRAPRLTLYGGLATGDNGFDMGPALAASFNWNISDAPFNFRIDPYFAYHSADNDDASLWFLGTTANLELAFRATGTSAEPYLFGGGGFYFVNFDSDDPDFDDSEFKGAFDFGGGVRFGGLTLEAKMQDIDEFTNVSFLVGFRLGG